VIWRAIILDREENCDDESTERLVENGSFRARSLCFSVCVSTPVKVVPAFLASMTPVALAPT
jgi:hypothetical protein